MTMTDPTVGAAAREAGSPQQGAGHQLVLMPLCDRSWRLCDRSVTHTDPSSVIAYVEELEDGTYEAVWVSGGFGCARYVSLEPLLGPLPSLDLSGIDWVIIGGESGPNHRPLDLDWVRDLRDRCAGLPTALFFKQVGGPTPKAGGRLLDGRTWDEYPQEGRRG